MIDPVTVLRIATLHPKIRKEVEDTINELEANGVRVRIAQALRSMKEQERLYAQGRTRPGKIVTKAKAGLSYHNYGLAIDFCLLHADGTVSWSLTEDLDKDGIKDWDEVQAAFEKKGYYLGENFGDNPHIEKSFGLDERECLALHTAGKVDAEGYIIIA